MNRKNLANAELNAPITAGATSIVVKSGQGATFPPVPFYATITPLGVLSTLSNSEIVKVTAVSGDTLTVVRAQRGTSGKSFIANDIIGNGVYTEDIEIKATINTASATAAKVATSTGGNVVPEAGMKFMFTFVNGNSVDSPTISLDGSTAYPITLGNTAANTTVFTITGQVDVPMWFDGSSFHLYGSHRTSDTGTSTIITNAEIDAGTDTTGRLISGQRSKYIQDQTKAFYQQGTAPTDTNKFWVDTSVESPFLGGDASTVNGYQAAATPTPLRIPVLDANGKMPRSTVDESYGSNYIAGSASTTSTAFTDIGSPQSVTITIPPSGKCKLGIYSGMGANNTNTYAILGYTMSGANTASASDILFYRENAAQPVGSTSGIFGRVLLLTGLTPGQTTFTLKYRTNNNTSSFERREIWAEA